MKAEIKNQNPADTGRRAKSAGLWLLASGLCFLLLAAGCTTAPKSVPPPPPNISPQPAPTSPAAPPNTKPPEPTPSPKPPPAPPNTPPQPSSSASTPELEKDEIVLTIDSQPAGAIVVVNSIPIGKAPLRLKVKATPQGFFRDYVTVKARFLATSAAETSLTVENDCTPLQRIPAAILFTPRGAQRQKK
jgi:hypothetical protein